MKNSFLVLCVMALLFASCEDTYIPKPKGYARIDFETHSYQKYEKLNCPFTFEYGELSQILSVPPKNGNKCWFNIVYPQQKSKIHFSYFDLTQNNLDDLIEDSRKLAMKHLVRADDFEESIIQDTAQNVYGTIYDFKGGSASNYQFFLTDSTNHLVRGALYFEVQPNADSLSPAEIYIEEEILYLINSFQWK